MKKWLPLLLLSLPSLAQAVNPSMGIHNLSSNLGGTIASYTSPTGYNTQASGSSFIVTVYTAQLGAITVSDTYNTSTKWTQPTFASGANPIQNTNNGLYLYTMVCLNCSGGTNDEITATQTTGQFYFVSFTEIKNTTSIDSSGSAYAASGNLTLSVTPSVANDLFLAVGATGASNAIASGNTWTSVDSAPDIGLFSLADAAKSAQDALLNSANGSGETVGVTVAFKAAGGSSCTHDGISSAGAIAVPNGSSGSYQGKSSGFVTPDCSSANYKQTQGAFGTSMLWRHDPLWQRTVSLEAMAH